LRVVELELELELEMALALAQSAWIVRLEQRRWVAFQLTGRQEVSV
jgi:hypothetical protein